MQIFTIYFGINVDTIKLEILYHQELKDSLYGCVEKVIVKVGIWFIVAPAPHSLLPTSYMKANSMKAHHYRPHIFTNIFTYVLGVMPSIHTYVYLRHEVISACTLTQSSF